MARSRSAKGESGATLQFWPSGLNASGGAPTVAPRRTEPGSAQAAEPSGTTPIARSR